MRGGTGGGRLKRAKLERGSRQTSDAGSRHRRGRVGSGVRYLYTAYTPSEHKYTHNINSGVTDGSTDRQIKGQTDGRAKPLLETRVRD